MQLRNYQLDAISNLRKSIQKGNRKIILHAPTGAGKTVIATKLVSLAREKGNKILFLANRRELISQAKDTMSMFGIQAGIIMAGEEPDFNSPIQIASMQTYVRRMDLDDLSLNPWFHDADLIIVDEAHGSVSPSYRKILDSYSGTTVSIGLTATPCRGDGRGLGEYYDDIVATTDIGELMTEGYLVHVRYFVPSTPDLEKIKTIAGDYDKKELGKRMDQKKLVGNIVENWLKIAPNRQTIIFAVNIKHSLHIVDSFTNIGIKAEHVDAKTPTDERSAILKRLREGDTQIVSNVGILTEGFDFPAASCIVLARPTKSLGLYLQMAGRGLRTFERKKDMVLIDHGGCVENHGLLEWGREWSVNGKEKAWKDKKKDGKNKRQSVCRVCTQVFSGLSKCPDCNTPLKSFGREIAIIESDLKEISPKKATVGDKRVFLGMLKYWVARQKNNNPKRINGSFRGRYGVWPHHSYKDVCPIEPDNAFLSYMRHQAIKYAKRAKNV